jgi:formylglycine-generating enzyme required for sulfatase activity
MADETPPQSLKVFISYSRRDSAFTDRLVAALRARGLDVKIDRQDLPKLEDWQRELLGFIRAADTIVFVVSNHSLASNVVSWEIEQVRLNHKRLAPVVIADVRDAAVPPEIARINYLYFTDEALFERNADDLALALNTDLDWVKEHTRLSEAARRWIERGKPRDALFRGGDLADAGAWAARRRPEAPAVTQAQREFLAASTEAEASAARWRRRLVSAVAVLLIAGAAYSVESNLAYLKIHGAHWVETIWPATLTAAAERRLPPGARFRECSNCPEMVAVPAGAYRMGSPDDEKGRTATESPQHPVAIRQAFAVSRFAITFREWDACVSLGGCAHVPADQDWGRRDRPVINIDWNDALQYASWVSRETGKPYRLLSEAEWEYAARGGTTTAYFWGNEIGTSHANCKGCGSQWDNKQTAPVGSFAANAFGLNDMHGNSWTWVEDCWHDSYVGAPADASAWTSACTSDAQHVVRGGAWDDLPANIRAASRFGGPNDARNAVNGIRLARTLDR